MRILLADDHNVLRAGLRRILEELPDAQVVGEARDGREAVELAASLRPDVIVMDIGMPHLNGIEATRRIVEHNRRIHVVVLSMYCDESYVAQVLRAGAIGYLLKDSAEEDLVLAVRAVARGQTFFSPRISQLLLGDAAVRLTAVNASDPYDALTPREREVFQLIAEGKTNKEAAASLGVSPTTVETHRARILEKLHLHSPVEIVLYAVRRGIIHPAPVPFSD